MAKKKSVKKVSKEEVARRKKRLSDRVNHLDYHEFTHVKIASIGFILFILAVWPDLRNVLMSVHWGWYLGLFLAFSIKPFRSFWFIPRE